MTTEKLKNIVHFNCDLCHFITNNKNDFTRHTLTTKHKTRLLHGVNATEKLKKNHQAFSCDCGKEYKDRGGLWRHKKKCTYEKSSENGDPSNNNILIFELLKSNTKFKELIVEQNKQILELVKEKGFGGSNNNINSNNVTNNKFNLNLFLNEPCKDAMNIGDFIKSLEISF